MAEISKQERYFNQNRALTWLVVKVAIGVLVTIIVLVYGVRYANSNYQVYQAQQDKKSRVIDAEAELEAAEFQKRIAVQEALAKRDSAADLAEAEIIRARGVAEANSIIADSITEEYVRWLYVSQLPEIQGQIIYIPTEGGIPILEAERFSEEGGE